MATADIAVFKMAASSHIPQMPHADVAASDITAFKMAAGSDITRFKMATAF